jgi:two-component system LytT family response regulator
MPKAIIIEDEQQAANLLETMLFEIDPSVQVVEKCRDLPAGVKSIKKHAPDIVFLDIELPVYSGIQLLDFFNPEEINFHIIFTTASNEYAVRAFEMSAVDYLMKPLQAEKLKASLEKFSKRQLISGPENLPVLKQNLQPYSNRKIVVPVTSGFEILNLKDICYFRAEGSYTQIFLVDHTSLLVSKNLKHFEFILCNVETFVRVHRSFIVNLNFVKKILRKDGGMVLLENQIELPIAEDKTQKIIELLQKY